MNQLKRWVSSLSVRVERVLAQVENHEAIADAAIQDVRKAAARAKVQLGRVERDGERLEQQLDEQRRSERAWRERAASCSDSEAERAIECLRRAKRAENEIPELSRRLERHRGMEKQLRADVERVEERLSELADQRNLMRLRQSRAEALGGARAAEVAGGDVTEVFDRWDTQITELELGETTIAPSVDTFARDYEASEQREVLLEEWAELKRSREVATSADEGGSDARS